jgi:hypothetical protein
MDSHSPVAAIGVLLLTAIVAYFLLFARQSPSTGDRHERIPPTLPLAFPLIGHLPQFLSDTESLLGKAS